MATKYYFHVKASFSSMLMNIESPISLISQTETSGMTFLTIILLYFINYYWKGKPEAPLLLLSQYGRDYLQVSWNVPHDGGCDLVNYYLLFFNHSSSSWTPFTLLANAPRVYVIHSFSLPLSILFINGYLFRNRFTHLNLQTSYNFQIIATNLVGASITNTAQFSTDSGIMIINNNTLLLLLLTLI